MNVEVGDRVVARTSDGIAYTGVIIEVRRFDRENSLYMSVENEQD